MKVRPFVCSLALCLGLSAPNAGAEPAQGDEMERARCSGIIDLFVADPALEKDEQALAAAQDRALASS